MSVLIVCAHREPMSFNGAMRDVELDAQRGAGDEVAVSGLYAMRFNPVAGRGDVTLPAILKGRVDRVMGIR